ncbi:hypothetical protein BO99DRAFT_236441 [Aspergillus violaceofuscus CBS 115571]|uniref:Uncharacterized protein n=1 Tax=Aspergillus violaceofuscus (strain CBS 115571) TaxID=1450538 RepID=A0A2V5I898_ASPV1|nr:hypothetical protein BO99DRAFT_236441 [Aspergillus violaceofuscus CBS 115571]
MPHLQGRFMLCHRWMATGARFRNVYQRENGLGEWWLRSAQALGRYRFGKLRERGFPAANWVGVRADYIGNRALYITFTGGGSEGYIMRRSISGL